MNPWCWITGHRPIWHQSITALPNGRTVTWQVPVCSRRWCGWHDPAAAYVVDGS